VNISQSVSCREEVSKLRDMDRTATLSVARHFLKRSAGSHSPYRTSAQVLYTLFGSVESDIDRAETDDALDHQMNLYTFLCRRAAQVATNEEKERLFSLSLER
jgi:hypothetical protein